MDPIRSTVPVVNTSRPQLPAAKETPRDVIVRQVPTLRSYALALTQDRAMADDAVADIVIKAWNEIDAYPAGTCMRFWLFKLLRERHFATMKARRIARREARSLPGVFEDRFPASPGLGAMEELAAFRGAFAALPVHQREALILVGAEGFPSDIAAEICGCSARTLTNRVNRGKRHLRLVLTWDCV